MDHDKDYPEFLDTVLREADPAEVVVSWAERGYVDEAAALAEQQFQSGWQRYPYGMAVGDHEPTAARMGYRAAAGYAASDRIGGYDDGR